MNLYSKINAITAFRRKHPTAVLPKELLGTSVVYKTKKGA